jgi:ribosomal protein S18 acetylase RimI-like enzyme
MKADLSLLDNPVWHALTGPQARFAVGEGRARGFVPQAAPFFAIADTKEAAYRDLGAILGGASEARLFRAHEERVPKGWARTFDKPIVQMLCTRALPVRSEAHVMPLGATDNADMLALAAATRPGPFGPRTAELGAYVGIRVNGQLVAMAGERFRLPGFTEISAICTLPAYRGKGYGAAMTAHLANAILGRGEAPILHVFPDNPAIKLYAALGFEERGRLRIVWLAPSDRRR